VRGYTPNSQYVGHFYHVSFKDQFPWRLCCCFEVKFFYFLDILFICSMVDMNMSLPKINCPGDFVIWYYDFAVFHFCVQRNYS
jgi:hypothetical protein